MHRKIKIFYMLCTCFFLCFMAFGCGLKKEVLLEYTSQDQQEVLEQENKDEADAVVINGQITNEADVSLDESSTGLSQGQIYVYVCGQVESPGVFVVDENTRLFQVIEMAGGLTAKADETSVNQAQVLVDGQMIYIPAVGESVGGATIGSNVLMQMGTTGMTLADSGKVNINTANLEELMTLTGIGQGKAQKILDYRQEHGAFQSIEELMNVDGIKEGTFSKLKEEITI